MNGVSNFQDKESMASVLKAVDKAGGYMYGQADGATMSSLMSDNFGAEYDFSKTAFIKEKYFSMDNN